MKNSRIFLILTILTISILFFAGCKGVVPPSPGTTEDVTVISGKIKMPLNCCSPEGGKLEGVSDKECDEAEFWSLVPNAVVELRSAERSKCKTVLATTFTDKDGNYVFDEVKPGLYIITAYCPVEGKNGFFLKDVAEKIKGEALDAGNPDCTSTALALVIEKINNCYNDWYQCYNRLTKIYKLVEEIAKDVGKVDINAIMNHDRFGDYCDNIDDDLVDLVCAFGCCASPGETGGGGGGGPTPDPCAGHTAPYDVVIDNLNATVGEVYTGKVTAKDDDDDVLSFAFAEGYTPPHGMTINSSTGVITWDKPTVDDICNCQPVATSSSIQAKIVAPNYCPPVKIVVSDRCHSTPAEFCIEVEDAPKYPVTYNNNGGTGSQTDSNSPYYAGAEVTVLDKGDMAKANYHFTGWNTKADGTGTAYAPDATFTMPAEAMILYAQWAEDSKYTVTYDLGGAPGTAPTEQDHYAGDNFNLANTPTWENHTFTGWKGDDGVTYSAGSNFTMPAKNVEFTALWEENAKYRVYYHVNHIEGSGSQVDDNDYYENDIVTVKDKNDMAVPNHTFVKWNTEPDGTGDAYNPADTLNMPNHDVTLYAQWEEDCVTFYIDVDYNVDSKKGHIDTILYWYAPPNHISTSGGRDYVKVKITASRALVAGEQVILDFSQKSVSPGDKGKIMLEVSGYTGQTATNGSYNNNTGLVTFTGPLAVGQEFYAVFRKAVHDWGNKRYPNDKKVTLELCSSISCPNPPTADILFDDEETNI